MYLQEELQLTLNLELEDQNIPDRPFTFLSSGLGVDSSALMVLTLTDPNFFQYCPDWIIFSDTGSEMPYTYSLVLPSVNNWLLSQGYRNLDGSEGVIVLDHNDPIYRSPSRLGDMADWHMRQKKPGIPTRAIRSCTDGAKIAPFRRFVTAQKDLRFGKWKNYGYRHTVLIGIAADEAKRANNATALIPENAKYLEHRFPLIEAGITKSDCVEILKENGITAYKSGCYLCPFQPISKFWAVSVLYPELHAKSVAMENLAAARNPKLRIIGRDGVSLDQEIDRWVARQLAKNVELPDPWQVLTSNYKIKRCWFGAGKEPEIGI
jgi:3'-phosphoadenosine 5'-phosphosulfate sulfotransferase (PAPS reductase)/FAD synthetase